MHIGIGTTIIFGFFLIVARNAATEDFNLKERLEARYEMITEWPTAEFIETSRTDPQCDTIPLARDRKFDAFYSTLSVKDAMVNAKTWANVILKPELASALKEFIPIQGKDPVDSIVVAEGHVDGRRLRVIQTREFLALFTEDWPIEHPMDKCFAAFFLKYINDSASFVHTDLSFVQDGDSISVSRNPRSFKQMTWHTMCTGVMLKYKTYIIFQKRSKAFSYFVPYF